MTDVKEIADQIREQGITDFEDSNHVHDTLVNMHEIIEATQETLQNMAEKIRELPGVIPEYADAAEEAASSMSGIADELQSRIGEGITGQH